MKSLWTTAVGILALATTSCATTNLVQVWRDPNYRPTPVKRIFVVAVVPNGQYRVTLENAIAQSLLSKGFEVSTSAGAFPPDQLDDDKVVAYVKEMNVDLVVVPRLANGCGPQVYPPGYYAGSACVAVDVNVYAAKANPESPIWSGTSSTINFSSGQEAAASMAASLVYDLINARILVR